MGLDMAINNLVNNLYSKDISKKLKSALKVKWKNGKWHRLETSIWLFKR